MDAGEDGKPAYIQLLGETLKELDVSVGHIVITHWHHDHLGGLNNVMKLTKGTHTHTQVNMHMRVCANELFTKLPIHLNNLPPKFCDRTYSLANASIHIYVALCNRVHAWDLDM